MSTALNEPGTLRMRAWLEPYFSLRDKVLANRSFQKWASHFPFTRPIARKRAQEMFDICAGFVYSQVLYATVELDLINTLAQQPATCEELAHKNAIPVERMRRLLDAAVAIHILNHRSGHRYGLGRHGSAILGNPGVVEMIRHHAMFYRDLADPLSLLRGDSEREFELKQYWHYQGSDTHSDEDKAKMQTYSALMSASQPMVADQVLAAYSFNQHRCMMDIGGGAGNFLRSVAASYAELELMLFDLPPVVTTAEQAFSRQPVSNKLSFHPGSFLTDPLPQGADIISLVRILHDHDDESVRILLKRVREALPEGGTLLIAEPMAGVSGAETISDAYFGFYFLAMGQGKPRKPNEINAMLNEAGFHRQRLLSTDIPLQTSLIIAQ